VAEGFTCKVNPAEYRSACQDLHEHEDTGYCVLHFPGEDKEADFKRVKEGKLAQKDYDFSGAVFPVGSAEFQRFGFGESASFNGAVFLGEANFSVARFGGEVTDFSGARFGGEKTFFSGARFGGEKTYGETTYFLGAQFSGEVTDFQDAQFRGEATSFQNARFGGKRTYFSRALFGGETAYFIGAQFGGEQTYFYGAQFGGAETRFQEATFMKEVDFGGATFKERASFWGRKGNLVFSSGAWASFNNSRIEKPEQFTFNTVLLHPGWFINVDVRKVDFTDVTWYGMPGGPEGTLDEEIKEVREFESPHTLLAQACQRLSANAEQNHDYPLANEFYYWSMDALRKENWRRFGLIRTMYWALSGYGVRARRAFSMLLGIWAAFALLYLIVPSSPFAGFSVSDFGEATVYSLGAIARLNPEPKPDPGWFQFLVTLEGLLGPLQIGLLLLAIRRKVLR